MPIRCLMKRLSEIAKYYNDLGFQVFGVDFSEVGVELAKKLGIEAKVMDVDAGLDFESNSYDIIFAHYGNKEVQEHIADSDWDSKNAIIIIFSGGFPVDKEMDDYGTWWVSASHMEKKENICILLKEVVTK